MFGRINILSIIVIGAIALLLAACGAQPTPATEPQPASQQAPDEEQDADHAEAEEHAEDDHAHNEEAAEHAEADPAHDEEAAEHDHEADDHAHDEDAAAMAIADLNPVGLAAGEKLQVLATTNIIGDLAAKVAGDLIDLTVMIPQGSDPHTFSPTPQDVAAVAEADVVLSNGLGFEEFLSEVLDNAGGEAVAIATATGVETREFAAAADHEGDPAHDEEAAEHEEADPAHDEEAAEDEHEEDDHAHAHEGADPHVWLTPANAQVMVHNIAEALSGLDPANAATYEVNAEAYEAELAELDGWVKAQIETIPAENRKMVTDHDAFGYYADRYGLEVIGAVIPAYSTNASPSAQELAALQDEIGQYGVKAVFVSTTVNPELAQQVAADTGIQLVPLYTGSLGEPGSGADTYLDYIRYNTSAIVEALR